MPKNAEKYDCEYCNFICSKKSNWTKHILTAKHKFRTFEHNVLKDAAEKTLHKCSDCNKEYRSRSALWYHRKNAKKCQTVTETNIIVLEEKKPIIAVNTITNNHDLVVELLKQNNDLQRQIVELSKEPKTVNNYNQLNNTTNNNNQFNLNLFLNETCKDALNIDDFMDSLQLTFEDLEKTGELGFVQGITRIFLNGLKDLDVSMRPIHCTDIKRETVYIKDQDKWEKETAEKTRMRQALNQAVRKNLGLIPAWREEHPDCLRSNTKDNDEYIRISMNSLGSEYEDEQERMNEKIIRNVLKEVVLDRKAGSQFIE
jgi:hypothetical protein